jgi:DNA-binding MarR family transcriptional regulator
MTEADALVDALAQTAFDTTAALTSLANEHELTLPQLRILGVLRGRRMRMTDLAAHMGLEKSSLSGLVDRAERRGLLARERSHTDRRTIDVFLTTKGEQLASGAVGRARRLILPLVDALDRTEKRELRALLRKAIDGRTLATR